MALETHSRVAVPVVHDVLGTLFPPQHAAKPLKQHLFPDISDELAQAVVDDWFHSSQRDFTYLSMNGKYVPIGQILKMSLPRVLVEKGLVRAADASSFDVTPVTSILSSVPPRPSFHALHNALSTCKTVEFKLVAATNGAAETTRQLFDNALEAQESQKWEIFSCDEIQVAKPAPEVYEAVWRKLGMNDKTSRRAWFVASHTWDLFAAKRAGFLTAWTAYEEHLPLPELWGETDIVAKDLEDAARQLIAREEERAKNEFM
ncbi:hypothetical protein ACM66B_005428 [Microbotryomycetes sp. NB124-2]